MNLNHFCDPTANAYPPEKDGLVPAFDCITRNWTRIKREFPIHDECSGKCVIDFGLETELIVRCDCDCHHWGWTDISVKWRPGQIEK